MGLFYVNELLPIILLFHTYFGKNEKKYVLSYFAKDSVFLGIHGEGAIVNTLFGLLCWDEIFPDPPPNNVIYFSFQSEPLDLNTEEFYNSREMLFSNRLNWLKTVSHEVGVDILISYRLLCCLFSVIFVVLL